MRVNYAIWWGICSEETLFGLAREKSPVHTGFSYSDKAVENKDRHSLLLSLDYIPDLPKFICRPPV